MRALTTATGIPRRWQPLSRLGQNSVSASTSRRGWRAFRTGADGPGQVERAIEDAVRSEALAGQGLAGARGGGDDDQVAGQRGVQRFDQTADGQHFANRDGVDPDERAVLAQIEANQAQPLQQPFAVLVGGRHAEEPPRRA